MNFRCGVSRHEDRLRLLSPYCVSYEVSTRPFPGPFSSRW